MMLANGYTFRRWNNASDKISLWISGKGKYGFKLRVIRKVLRCLPVECASLIIQMVVSLMFVTKAPGHSMCIAQEKQSRIDKDPPTAFSFNCKSPEYGVCKCFFHRLTFVLIFRNSAVHVVGFCQQHLCSASVKLYDMDAA